MTGSLRFASLFVFLFCLHLPLDAGQGLGLDAEERRHIVLRDDAHDVGKILEEPAVSRFTAHGVERDLDLYLIVIVFGQKTQIDGPVLLSHLDPLQNDRGGDLQDLHVGDRLIIQRRPAGQSGGPEQRLAIPVSEAEDIVLALVIEDVAAGHSADEVSDRGDRFAGVDKNFSLVSIDKAF